MVNQLSLRARLMWAIVALVTLISTLFVFVVWEMKVRLEAVAFSHMVADQLDLILEAPGGPASFDESLLRDWNLYYGNRLVQMPTEFADLPEGSHHSVRVDGRYYQLEVSDRTGQHVVLSHDITEWELQEHWLLRVLALGVLLVLVVAVVAGWWSALAVLAPLKQLTMRLGKVRPDQRGVRIASDFQGSETAHIARAFDQYMERLDQFVEREKYFATAASHELRTPLSVMKGAVEVLDAQARQQAMTPAAERAVQRIERACEDMLGFVEVSLLLSREDSNPVADTHDVSVAAVIQQVCDDLAPVMHECHIQLDLEIAQDQVLQQNHSVIQVLIGNLLRNAVEHTQAGEIAISLQSSVLTVRDTGEGIAAAQLEHIFERGYSTKENGTGIGLNLVRRLCERFQWQLRLYSEPGLGTCVTVDFKPDPLADQGSVVVVGQLRK
jgi:signal transduction histidine kinase